MRRGSPDETRPPVAFPDPGVDHTVKYPKVLSHGAIVDGKYLSDVPRPDPMRNPIGTGLLLQSQPLEEMRRSSHLQG